MATPAVLKFFAVAELVEHVLLHVNCVKSVLLATEVSHQFEAVIKASPKIRKHLFLAPCSTVIAYDSDNDDKLIPQIYPNPLLFNTKKAEFSYPVPDNMLMSLDGPNSLFTFNSLIVPPEFLYAGGRVGYGRVDWDFKGLRDLAQIKKTSSCREMLLCDPPPTNVGIRVEYIPTSWETRPVGHQQRGDHHTGWVIFSTVLQKPSGVRFTQVLDLLEHLGVSGEVGMEITFKMANWHVRKEADRKNTAAKQQPMEVSTDDKRLEMPQVQIEVIQNATPAQKQDARENVRW